jgi:cytochrome c oxidase subunit 1
MLLLGYLGMPRRYATYNVGIGPIDLFTVLHQSATVGAFILLVGQLIFVWNIASSWLDGREVTNGDPWNLKDDDLYSREFHWFDGEIGAPEPGDEPALPDGGTESESEPADD